MGNLVFALNFLLLSTLLAGFRHWMTIAPYTFTLLIFMGLKEVSNALADPFGEDTVDFPLTQYLDYTFDHSVCLLQAFSNDDAYNWVEARVKGAQHFTDADIRRPVDKDLLYREGKFRAHLDSMFLWTADMPLTRLEKIVEVESIQERLKESMNALVMHSTYDDTTDEERRNDDIKRLKEQLQKAQETLDGLREAHERDVQERGGQAEAANAAATATSSSARKRDKETREPGVEKQSKMPWRGVLPEPDATG